LSLSPAGFWADDAGMAAESNIQQRVERAVFETDRQIVVGDVTLAPHGYQSRFSDMLNRQEFAFLSLTNVEITSLIDGTVSERPFLVIAKHQVRVAYPCSQ
jgi:hypothetical protein